MRRAPPGDGGFDTMGCAKDCEAHRALVEPPLDRRENDRVPGQPLLVPLVWEV